MNVVELTKKGSFCKKYSATIKDGVDVKLIIDLEEIDDPGQKQPLLSYLQEYFSKEENCKIGHETGSYLYEITPQFTEEENIVIHIKGKMWFDYSSPDTSVVGYHPQTDGVAEIEDCLKEDDIYDTVINAIKQCPLTITYYDGELNLSKDADRFKRNFIDLEEPFYETDEELFEMLEE